LPSLFLLGLKPGENMNIAGLLEEFGLLHYKEKLPFALSLGEKKRLTLVSLLGYTPPVLALDEPLVGQDQHRLFLFLKALQRHRDKGGSAIMICHEPSVVLACCQRILFLDQGKLMINASTRDAFQDMADKGLWDYVPREFYKNEVYGYDSSSC
jgi:energy-coupling factor transport system ATP-binding protein